VFAVGDGGGGGRRQSDEKSQQDGEMTDHGATLAAQTWK
jgi:hypothetical protein